MIETIELFIYCLGATLSVLLLSSLIILTIRGTGRIIKFIKKVDFAWLIVMSAKRRHETAEDVIDDIIGLCSSRTEGFHWRGLTVSQRDSIKRVIKKIDSLEEE